MPECYALRGPVSGHPYRPIDAKQGPFAQAEGSQGLLKVQDGESVSMQQTGTGRRSDFPWMQQLAETPDLDRVCRLTRSNDNLDVSAVCAFLKGKGCDGNKIESVKKDYMTDQDNLGEFFRKLSEALNVIIELRVKQKDGTVKNRMRFEAGDVQPYPEGHPVPLRDENRTIQVALRHDSNGWRWEFPTGTPVMPVDLETLNLGLTGQVRKPEESATGVVAQESLQGVQHKPDTVSEGTKNAEVKSGEQKKEPAKSLITHSFDETNNDKGVELREKTDFGEKIRPGALTSPIPEVGAMRPDEAASKLTQKDRAGNNTCWVLSGLYALMASEAGAAALRENVQLDAETGRATVHFPGFKTTVDLAMVVPLNDAGLQVYSNSDPWVELVTRAVDILCQHRNFRKVGEHSDPQLMMQAFGLDVYEPWPSGEKDEPDPWDKLMDALKERKGAPVTVCRKDHVVAVKSFDEKGGSFHFFDPLYPERDEVMTVTKLREKYGNVFTISIGQKKGAPALKPDNEWHLMEMGEPRVRPNSTAA